MLFIGITGGVGAGKSEVLKILNEREDTVVLLADEVAHLLMEKGQDCYNQIIKLFSDDDLLQENGEFDRQKLATVIFTDAEKREALNAIVHPAVKSYVKRAVDEERKKNDKNFFFFEAALLIEEQYGAICDELWYIYTNEQIRRERLKTSRGYSDEKITNILASQLSEEEYLEACDEKICNNGTPEELEQEISEVLRRKMHEC